MSEFHELTQELSKELDVFYNWQRCDKIIRDWLSEVGLTIFHHGKNHMTRDEIYEILGLIKKPLSERLAEAARYDNGVPPSGARSKVTNWDDLIDLVKQEYGVKEER